MYQEEISSSEQQKALDEFNDRQDKMYAHGKIIIIVIVALNIISAVVNAIYVHDLTAVMPFVTKVGLSFALYYGAPWVRKLFASACVIGAIYDVITIFGDQIKQVLINSATTGYIAIALLIVDVCYCITAGALLLFNKSVEEFLYSQKND